jgi:hypothetical protein
MKVIKLRETLGKIAIMQQNQGDAATANALEKLSKILVSRNREDVHRMVDSIQQRRQARKVK